jgi:hypothetical protein
MYLLAVAEPIACKEARLIDVSSCPCPPPSTFYKLLEIERGELLPLDRYYEGSGGCLSGTIIVSHALEEEMDHGEPYDPSGSDPGTSLHDGVIRGVGTQ